MSRRKERKRPLDLDAAVEQNENLQRLRASREIGYAYRTVRALRRFYIAFCALVLLNIALFAMADVDEWVVPSLFGFFLLLLTGAWQVTRSPLPWSIVIAVLFTAIQGLFLSASYVDHFGLVILFGLWGGVYLARRAQHLVERHPDLRISRRWRGERANIARTDAGDRVRARREAARIASYKRLLVGAGIVAGVIVLIVVLPGGGRTTGTARYEPPPPPYERRIDAFITAWNTEKVLDLQDFLLVGERDHRFPRILKAMRRRDWDQGRLPDIAPADIRVERGVLHAHFTLKGYPPEVQLRTLWTHKKGVWYWRASRKTWPPLDSPTR